MENKSFTQEELISVNYVKCDRYAAVIIIVIMIGDIIDIIGEMLHTLCFFFVFFVVCVCTLRSGFGLCMVHVLK